NGSTVQSTTAVQVTALGASVADVATGEGAHSCARKTDGTLWCWGYNANGQLGNGSTTQSTTPIQVASLDASVAQVARGKRHACERKLDGTLWCWRYNNYGQLGNGSTAQSAAPVQVAALGTSVAEVATAYQHTCARKTDGTLWCWGYNYYGL